MRHFTLLLFFLAVAVQHGTADDAKTAYLDSKKAGVDFEIQGEYLGTLNGGIDLGIQVIADGGGKFRSVGYIGGLPGAGWNGAAETRIPGSGVLKGDTCHLTADEDNGGRAEVNGGKLELYGAEGQLITTLKKIARKSPTLGQKPPGNAVVLFDGTTADHFAGGRLSDDGLLMEGATSKQAFGSYQLHMEFLLSFMPYARNQDRANSGSYQQSRYEVQILDSFGLENSNNHCGGIYGIAPPMINMCFPPLSWQTYDIDFQAAQYNAAGEKTKDATITVKHNGVTVQDNQPLPQATRAAPGKEGPEDGPLYLQNHNNPIRFRNIWLVPAAD